MDDPVLIEAMGRAKRIMAWDVADILPSVSRLRAEVASPATVTVPQPSSSLSPQPQRSPQEEIHQRAAESELRLSALISQLEAMPSLGRIPEPPESPPHVDTDATAAPMPLLRNPIIARVDAVLRDLDALAQGLGRATEPVPTHGGLDLEKREGCSGGATEPSNQSRLHPLRLYNPSPETERKGLAGVKLDLDAIDTILGLPLEGRESGPYDHKGRSSGSEQVSASVTNRRHRRSPRLHSSPLPLEPRGAVSGTRGPRPTS